MDNLALFKQFAPEAPKKFQDGNNAVIYTRVSSSDQEDNTSLASQKKHCDLYAQRRNLNVVGYFGGTYESAKTDDRKEFNRMLTFVKRSKNISYIIVYSYERFSRSGINGASIAEELLKKYGVITLAITQELDPTTPSGSFQQKIFFLFGQMDNELRRDKTVTGMKELLLKGYWVWAAPRGYKDLNKGKATERKLVINEEGKLLKKAFEWKAYNQLPNVEIVRRLKKMGVNLSERRLNDLFSNPFYCGLITSKMIPDQVVEGNHEAMISKELFLQVHNIRKEKRVHGFVHNKDNDNLPLKVFTKCSKCEKAMTGYLVKKKNLYYYKCRTKGCKVNRSAKAMHELFSNVLTNFKIEKEELDIIKVQLEEQMSGFFRSKIENETALKANLNVLKKKLENIEERFVIGEIDRPLYDKYSSKYKNEYFEIEQEIEKTSGYSSNLKKVIHFVTKTATNVLPLWESSTLENKKLFQKMLFPEGIYYNRELDQVRTTRINSFFSLIPEMTSNTGNKKSGNSIISDKKSALVTQRGFEPPTLRAEI
ncbi:recombinase family protein [Tenacibaculum sp. M341]|uniref:recombinase family protein n=1 Tax=Tenacibaculum sp. M341 TaxID=2530339 RepID=UPI0010471F87|nr:recombinase family protein [Tenacibaculum sp. M341]TCI91536.1 recombinase family protein [Tenacibaculum sp. M341]